MTITHDFSSLAEITPIIVVKTGPFVYFSRSQIVIWSKINEPKREGGAEEPEVITPGKVVPYRCCLPSLNISKKSKPRVAGYI